MRSSARYGAGAAPCSWPSSRGARLAHDLGGVGEIGSRLALAAAFLDLRRAGAPATRRGTRPARAGRRRSRARMPAAVEHAVLAERVLDDEPHGRLGAHEPRDQLRAAPAGDQAEEHLRAGEVAHARRDRAVVAVQRDLDAASERRAVDRRERQEGEIAQAAEELVPGLAALARALGGDPAELRRCRLRPRRRTACR